MALLGLAQAFTIAWLVGDVVEDNPGPLLPVAPAAHGHGGPVGAVPIAGDAGVHYLGLAAFAAHAVLPTLAAAVVVSRRLVTRRGGLVGGLVFAAAVGTAGAVVGVVTCWLALAAAGVGTGVVPAVTAIGATTAFRYSFLFALVFLVLGGTRWLATSATRHRTPAPMPGRTPVMRRTRGNP